MTTEIPLTATHYSLIIRELNALVTDVTIETEKHFLFVMTYNQCKMDKKSLIKMSITKWVTAPQGYGDFCPMGNDAPQR